MNADPILDVADHIVSRSNVADVQTVIRTLALLADEEGEAAMCAREAELPPAEDDPIDSRARLREACMVLAAFSTALDDVLGAARH